MLLLSRSVFDSTTWKHRRDKLVQDNPLILGGGGRMCWCTMVKLNRLMMENWKQSLLFMLSFYYNLWQNIVCQFSLVCKCLFFFIIVRKEVSTSPPHPISKSSSPFLNILHSPTWLANPSSQVFLINRNATVKLSSINTIHVKQQHVGFVIFRFTLKYLLGIVYINEIHARQCVYICLYCRKGFSHSFSISLLYPKESFT